MNMIHGRKDINNAQRVVIKVGTSVISSDDGYVNVSHVANIVEHTARLFLAGKEVILVSSGAVGVGKHLLRRQAILRRSVGDILSPSSSNLQPAESMSSLDDDVAAEVKIQAYNSACASTGQLGLSALYETLMSQFDIIVGQILVTSSDFNSPERRRNIQFVITELLKKGVIPIINENDPVSLNQGYETYGRSFSDNDQLASLISIQLRAHVLVLLTDVDGVFDRPPTSEGAKVIDIFTTSTTYIEGDKSEKGRGGMVSKVTAAKAAIDGGVLAVIIASGHVYNVIKKIFDAETVGTLFLPTPLSVAFSSSVHHVESTNEGNQNHQAKIEQVASGARTASYQLQQLNAAERTGILCAIADALESRESEIMAANKLDLDYAAENNVASTLQARLKLTPAKLKTLAVGIKSIANQVDPIGKLLDSTELSVDLELQKLTTPIGVLLVIFESRPDCLPQIAALALRSGNGVILKGGKEAEHSNALLHRIIVECVVQTTNSKVAGEVVGLVQTRHDIKSLLQLDHHIDLVIPRGSNALVQYIQKNTTIPVMGHADGVCHVFIDASADKTKAIRIVLDAKTDYPAACNAMETLLLHRATATEENGLADILLRKLRAAGVGIFGGPNAMSLGLTENAAECFHHEYGDLKCNVEVVDSLSEAIDHVNRYSSGHTECLVSEDLVAHEQWASGIDSACVFINASTRFADGFRFGLGAEVGIATGKIHARGPVGMEGLTTYKYLLKSTRKLAHTASDFAGSVPICSYTHVKK